MIYINCTLKNSKILLKRFKFNSMLRRRHYAGRISQQEKTGHFLCDQLCLNKTNDFTENENTTETFVDNIWRSDLLSSLFHLFETQELTDVTIRTENEDLRAHKLVLSLASPFFKSVFSPRWSDNKSKDEVNLQSCDSESFKLVLSYMYSGKIELTVDNVAGILSQSEFFQLPQLESLCCRFLKTNLSVESCLEVYEMASLHQCESLKENSFKFARRYLSEVLMKNSFLSVKPETVLDILTSPVIGVNAEDELYLAILRWLHFCNDRELWRFKMLSLLKVENLTEENQESFQEEIDRLTEDNLLQKIEAPRRHKKEIEILMIFGGESSGNLIKNAESMVLMEGYCFTDWTCSIIDTSEIPEKGKILQESKKNRVIPAPFCKRIYGTSVNKNNEIFLIGGLNCNEFLNSVEVYSFKTNTFEEFDPLPEPLHGCAGDLFQHEIWVVGGRNLESDGSSVWVYSDSQKKWVSKPPLMVGRSHHGVASLGKFLYAVGGVPMGQNHTPKGNATALCEKFDPFSNTWKPVSELLQARSYHCVVAAGDYVYAIGGYNGNHVWLNSVEKYDPIRDQWIFVDPMHMPRSSFGAAVCHGNIYCVGGFNGSNSLNTLERYHPNGNRWQLQSATQFRRLGFVAGSVTVPFDRFESETMARRRREAMNVDREPPEDDIRIRQESSDDSDVYEIDLM